MIKYISSLLIATCLLTACSKSVTMAYERTGEVNAVSHENSIVVLSSQARAENLGKAVYFSERNAFENLIFKGIPNTNQESPMIANESRAISGDPAFFDEFFANQGYRKYVMDSYTANQTNVGGVKLIEQIVKIDLKGLRNYLESNGVAKSFGL